MLWACFTNDLDSSSVIPFSFFTHAGCTEDEVRLLGGANYTEGRVEICFNDEWGTICDQMWDATDAGVVCRQLGLATNGM